MQNNKIRCGVFSHRIPFFQPTAVFWIPIMRSASLGRLSIREATFNESRGGWGVGLGLVTCRLGQYAVSQNVGCFAVWPPFIGDIF